MDCVEWMLLQLSTNELIARVYGLVVVVVWEMVFLLLFPVLARTAATAAIDWIPSPVRRFDREPTPQQSLTASTTTAANGDYL